MSVKLYLVGSGSLDDPSTLSGKMNCALTQNHEIEITGHATDIRQVLMDIRVNEVDFDKILILMTSPSNIAEFQSALVDIYALFMSEPSKATCEVKLMTKYQEAIDVFKSVAAGNYNFTYFRIDGKLSPAQILEFCLNCSGSRMDIESVEDEEINETIHEDPPTTITGTEINEINDTDKDNGGNDDNATSIDESKPNEETTIDEREKETVNSDEESGEETSDVPVNRFKKSAKSEGRFSSKLNKFKSKSDGAAKKINLGETLKSAVSSHQSDDSDDAPVIVKKKTGSTKFVSKMNLNTSEAIGEEAKIHITGSYIIGVTGTRGSGVSSTVANLAHTARVVNNMKACVVCLDFDFRSINHYYSKFQHDCTDPNINAGLYELMNTPKDYMNHTSHIVDGYDVVSLSFDYKLTRNSITKPGMEYKDMQKHREALIDVFPYIKLANLLGFLKSVYNIVIVDFPLEYVEEYRDLMLMFDRFALCFSNTSRSIANTVMQLEKSLLDIPDIYSVAFLNKTKIVLTDFNPLNKFNKKAYTLQVALDRFATCASPNFQGLVLAGIIPHSEVFDVQLDDLTQLVVETDDQMSEAYQSVLSSLIS